MALQQASIITIPNSTSIPNVPMEDVIASLRTMSQNASFQVVLGIAIMICLFPVIITFIFIVNVIIVIVLGHAIQQLIVFNSKDNTAQFGAV